MNTKVIRTHHLGTMNISLEKMQRIRFPWGTETDKHLNNTGLLCLTRSLWVQDTFPMGELIVWVMTFTPSMSPGSTTHAETHTTGVISLFINSTPLSSLPVHAPCLALKDKNSSLCKEQYMHPNPSLTRRDWWVPVCACVPASVCVGLHKVGDKFRPSLA